MKLFLRLATVVVLIGLLSVPVAFGQGSTILPKADVGVDECKGILDAFEKDGVLPMKMNCDQLNSGTDALSCENLNKNIAEAKNLLGCAIKTGRISLQMIPYFITFFSNWLLGISGLISVLFIVIGGYMYIYGGLSDNKERGKKYISHAVMGMVLALLAWVIVNGIIAAVTS